MLSTENTGTPVNTKRVKVLIGTMVRSVGENGQDVTKGQIIDVSPEDYRFLKGYGYVEDYNEEAANPEPETVEEVEATEEVVEEKTSTFGKRKK